MRGGGGGGARRGEAVVIAQGSLWGGQRKTRRIYETKILSSRKYSVSEGR